MAYDPTVWKTGDIVSSYKLNKIENGLAGSYDEIARLDGDIDGLADDLDNEVAALRSQIGSPLVANTAEEMTNINKVYVYTGSETGYTAGHWYYFDGTAWTDGGVYNAVAVQTDKTLTVPDMPADAKKTGDEIEGLKEELTASSKELGVYTGVFKSTGAAHSSNTDQVPVSIKAGESFSVRAAFDVTVSGTWQCWAIYSDGTSEAVITYYPNQEAAKVAKKDIVAIGIAFGAQSSAYTCTVTINSEKSVLRKIEANTEDISANQKTFEDVVIDLSPVVFNVSWENGRINSDGGNQDSSTYVRTAEYILISEFEYVHLAAKCQIEVFFYNDAETKISSKIYGSSSSVEQDIYLDYPSGTSKVRVVQYMHNTAWKTTVEDAANDIKVLSNSHIMKALDIAYSDEAEIGKITKDITVAAGTNHSSNIEQDKIYISNLGNNPYVVYAQSKRKAVRGIQALGFAADYSYKALASFYTDGNAVGVAVSSDIVAIGFAIANQAATEEDVFTVSVAQIDTLSMDLKKDSSDKFARNARHVKGLTRDPLTLLHISDIHADTVAYQRIIHGLEDLNVTVDDAICTGDMNEDVAGSIESWWNPNVLTCIGNHDCATRSDNTYNYNWTALSMSQRDAYYIAPFESNWGVAHESGKSYYYKDYASAKVRLIVMDGMLYMSNSSDATDQTTWLENLLSDAITNDLHVLIAIHAPHDGATAVECSFSRYGQSPMPLWTDCNTPQSVIDTVAAKIESGLKFVGYLVGHTHQDNIWDATGDGKQLMYCITCSAVGQPGLWKNSDQHRNALGDAYNLVTIDTENTLVKIIRCGGADIDDHMRTRKAICFNYSTGEKVGEVL